jgi:hypothetical protein
MPRIVVLEFKRSPQWFLDVIIRGEALDGHRAAMLAVGRPCFFGAHEAKLIVAPEEVNDALFHLSSFGVTFDEGPTLWWDDLHPRHVIVSESLEVDVLAAIDASPGSGLDGGKGHDKVKVKRRVVIDVPLGPWHRAPVSEGCTSDVSDNDDFCLNFSF